MNFLARHKTIWSGLAVLCAFICALMVGIQPIGARYKVQINGFMGISSGGSGDIDSYAYTSDYDSTSQLLGARKEIAEDLNAEGSVLLKNKQISDANTQMSLPLTKAGAEEIKVTLLGNRAYTYTSDSNGNDTATVRDKFSTGELTVYGGITGSIIRGVQNVTVEDADGNTEKLTLPVTLERALAANGVAINKEVKKHYSDMPFPNGPAGSHMNGAKGAPFTANEGNITFANLNDPQKEYSDAALVFIGRASGEGRDYLPGSGGVAGGEGLKSALGLSDQERNLIAVANEVSDNVIVLINSAVAMEIGELKDDPAVDSVLWIGLPGAYGMNGVARVLTGKESPSGKLSDIWARDNSVTPAAQNFGYKAPDTAGETEEFVWGAGGDSYRSASNGHYVVLAENNYVGYRYFETRYNDVVEGDLQAASETGRGYDADKSVAGWKYSEEVAYGFGYGLSYGTFTQEIVQDSLTFNVVQDENGNNDLNNSTVSVQVKVTNTGSIAAKNVVQLYMQSPYTDYDKRSGVEKPAIQLMDFAKAELEPSAETTVTLSVPLKYIASYDKNVSHDGVTGGYILEDANYYFAIGNGAHDALNSVLLAQGKTLEQLAVETGESPAAANAVSWNPSSQSAVLGTFTNGVNASALGKSQTGETVKNQMTDADYNTYNTGTQVTYLTRSAWSDTYPVSYKNLPVNSTIGAQLGNFIKTLSPSSAPDGVGFDVDHTIEEDDEGLPLENLTVSHFKMASFDDENWDYFLQQISFKEAWLLSPMGGASCNRFVANDVNAPQVWQADGPNGNVTSRLGERSNKEGYLAVTSSDPNYNYYPADMPAEPTIAATFNKQLLEEEGRVFGDEMLWSNNPMMWAPGMNLHRTPFNSRNHEYYSEDPMLTNLCGASFVYGGLSKGAILSAKHFAFNTQESYREGLSQFMEEQSARELELRAFEGLVDIKYVNELGNEIGALGLMTSFSRVGAVPGNAHTGYMKNVLRKEWGYKGLSSSDYVGEGYYFKVIDAVYNNVTFLAHNSTEESWKSQWPEYSNMSEVRADGQMAEALYDNMHYYMYSLANSSALNGLTTETVVPPETAEWWQNALVVLSIVSGILIGVFALLAVVPHYFNAYWPVLKPKLTALRAKPTKDSDDGEGGDA